MRARAAANKARRPREASSSDASLSPQGMELFTAHDLYEIHGDANAALTAMSSSNRAGSGQDDNLGATDAYNRMLLSYVVSASNSKRYDDKDNERKAAVLAKMEEWQKSFRNKDKYPALPNRKRVRNEWIAAYNRALVLHANGRTAETVEICVDKLYHMVLERKQKPPDELAVVSSRMAFLLLEAILTKSAGSHMGICNVHKDLTAEAIIEWLELLNATFEKNSQLKFLFVLYKSRLDFGERDKSGKHMESKIRSARKDLKTAMEVFQQKLRPSGAGEESLASVDSDSLPNTHNNQQQQQQQQHPPLSVVLQEQNQAALNLKANLEQLKGNMKKSLVLCGEALAATSDDQVYQAMHANNLALVYESTNKRHLALHSVTKALLPPTGNNLPFRTDGTARPDSKLLSLHNSSLCALLNRNFAFAFESMSTCVRQSEDFSKRPRCWLRLAEACIGLYSQQRKTNGGSMFATVELDGEPNAVLVRKPTNPVKSSTDTVTIDDIEKVKSNALLCTKACLERTFRLLKDSDKDEDCLLSARLAMAYVALELGDFEYALALSNDVNNMYESKWQSLENGVSEVDRRMLSRRAAISRMYAAEASCALGDSISGMRFLVGAGQDNAFDRLASDLGGVTLEVAATNPIGKSRLARAQAMVRSSASAASAVLGNTSVSKQLAMSAQAMEDVYSSSRERSYARKALVFCILREGKSGAALTLLRSLC